MQITKNAQDEQMNFPCYFKVYDETTYICFRNMKQAVKVDFSDSGRLPKIEVTRTDMWLEEYLMIGESCTAQDFAFALKAATARIAGYLPLDLLQDMANPRATNAQLEEDMHNEGIKNYNYIAYYELV